MKAMENSAKSSPPFGVTAICASRLGWVARSVPSIVSACSMYFSFTVCSFRELCVETKLYHRKGQTTSFRKGC